MDKSQIKRCAIYTRKSTDENLQDSFNSLDAQREAAEAYIQSQKMNGWRLLPDRYDDGGYSGGNMNRPGLKKLLEDVKAGKIDIVIVYKLDRLSRSICDFAELSKIFDKHGTSFVSVTQEINTTTSSGRMMLNILVTFAQYEREVIAERIRDKMSASRKKGKWVGGSVPLGYKVVDKHLHINEEEVEIVKRIFTRFLEIGSPRQIAFELEESGVARRDGRPWNVSHIYRILQNHTYIGKVNYKGEIYEGEHEAIIDKKSWDEVQEHLKENDPMKYLRNKKQETVAILKGVIRCGHCGCAMGPTYARRRGRKYLYYLCVDESKRGKHVCPVNRVAAPAIEEIVLKQVQKIMQTETVQKQLVQDDLPIEKVKEYADNFAEIWDEIFPIERQRILGLFLEKVVVYDDHVDIEIKTGGLTTFIEEMTNGND